MVNDRGSADEKTNLLEASKSQPGSTATYNDLAPHFRPLLASSFIAFIAGLNDGNLAIILPQLKDYYHISNATVSCVFLCHAIGFFLAASCNGYLVHKLGQLCTIQLGAMAVIIGYLILSEGMVFSITCLSLVIQGGGMGLMDNVMDVYAANIPMATLVLNILHAVYGVGAMISPLIGTYLLAYGVSWKGIYMCLLGAAIINLVLVTIGFHNVDLESTPPSSVDQPIVAQNEYNAILNRVTFLAGFYILILAGIEACVGSWGYLYLTESLHGNDIEIGYAMSAYWGGLAMGRIVLGWYTEKWGEKKMVALFTMITACLFFLTYMIPNVWVDSILLGLIGFFIGPLLPSCISLTSKVLPRDVHPEAIGFVSAFGAGGVAFFPFFAGQIAGFIGLNYMPLLWFAGAVVMQVFWIFIPNGNKL